MQVLAVNVRGASAPSPTLSITTLQEPPSAPPTHLRAHARQPATISLTWQVCMESFSDTCVVSLTSICIITPVVCIKLSDLSELRCQENNQYNRCANTYGTGVCLAFLTPVLRVKAVALRWRGRVNEQVSEDGKKNYQYNSCDNVYGTGVWDFPDTCIASLTCSICILTAVVLGRVT